MIPITKVRYFTDPSGRTLSQKERRLPALNSEAGDNALKSGAHFRRYVSESVILDGHH
jgi:hypothetical protein